ncbi:MAG: lysine--tRNA ligase [Actinobacteria bacterium]|nr:lysine--tRNA ligase [Actinomycetota bacterium]
MQNKDNYGHKDLPGEKDYGYYAEIEESLSEPLKVKIEKIKDMASKGHELYYSGSFKKTAEIGKIIETFSGLQPGEKSEEVFKTAGRLMLFRVHGKATFCDLKGYDGKIQLYLSMKNIGENKYNDFLSLDIGDWIGVEGNAFVTHRGELSINVTDYKLLSKSVRIMPEKWHGLKDVELRYRQRYLDFIVNPEVKKIFLTRIKVIEEMRGFLSSRGFLEVETPMLHPIPGGAAAKPFITHHNALDMDLYLRIAPELYLKRLVIAGFEKVFEINRNFRNEGISHKHNPEFTMVEFYQAFADYNDMMELTEEMIKTVTLKATGSLNFSYRGNDISLDGNWEKISMIQSIEKYGGLKVSFDTDINELKKICSENKIEIAPGMGKGKIINEIFEKTVEPKLIQPVFIKDYPVEISPLARRHARDSNLTERFELFIGGEEVANAFSELIDPRDQAARFKQQAASGDEEERLTGKIDLDFLKALEYGMPPTGGEGIGVDRFVMIITDSKSLRDVILFPILRPDTD